MGFKVEEKFRIILVMKEVNLTNGNCFVSVVEFEKLKLR